MLPCVRLIAVIQKTFCRSCCTRFLLGIMKPRFYNTGKLFTFMVFISRVSGGAFDVRGGQACLPSCYYFCTTGAFAVRFSP